MNNIRNFRLFVGMTLVLTILACNFSQTAPEAEPPAPAPPTSAPPPAPEPTPEAPPAIEHKDVPIDLPYQRTSQAGDQESSQTANQKRAPGGDRFTFGRYERPFNANTMDVYFPYLDIVNTIFYEDETWIYAAITLKDADPEKGLAGRYAFEIDTNLDGRGEWLVLVSSPSSTEWSVAGVQVWHDANQDVGGQVSIGADERGAGDGYETSLVDNGQGEDPDLAWARLSPKDPNTVELAVKRSLLKGDTSYMAGAWAGSDSLDPARFDFNDHMTHEQAGTALIELENFYPIKELAELDNVCRVAVGFTPKGNEPGLCVTTPPKEKQASCPSGQYICYNFGNQQICVCVP